MIPLIRTSFFDQLRIDHGPRDLIRKFFIVVDQAFRDAGIHLSFGTFSELNQINLANRDSWRPLLSTFQPVVGGVTDADGFVILGMDYRGDVVATQALRIFDWSSTDFKTEAESLRLIYAHPDLSKLPNESCVVTAPNAMRVTGRMAMSGAGWYRPDYRGRKLGHFFPRMSRIYALGCFNIDGAFAMFSRENVAKKLPVRAGFCEVREGVLLRNSRSDPGGDLIMSLGRQTAGDIVDDAFHCLMDGLPQIDTFITKRRA